MKDEHETKQPLTNESAELRQRIAELETVETGDKRVENATQWNRMWLPTAGMFVLLCILVCLTEILDLPHLLLGAPRTPINWQEAIIETALILTVGLFTILKLIHDITERKRAEEALRESEKRYRDLIESTYDMIQSVAPDGRFVFVNRAWLETLGYTEAELPSQNLWKIIHPESLPHCQKVFSRVMDGEPIRNVQATFVTKDGKSILVEGNATGRYVGGKLVATHGFFRDITERKRAEEALKEAQRYTRGLIEANMDALVTISAEGKISDVNRATELITGMSRQEIIGMDFSNYFTDPGAARKGYQQVFRDGYVRDYPLEVKHRDGKVTPVVYNASVYKDARGRIAGVFAAARDITERKRAEEALRQYAERLRILHEIDQAILAAWSPEEIAQAACERIRQLVPCQRASIAVFDLEADQAIVLVADVNAESHVETGTRLPLAAYSALDVVRRGPARYVEDIRALPERPPVVQQLLRVVKICQTATHD